MKSFSYLPWLLGVVSITSCNSISENLDYELRLLEYQSPNCEPERDACLMVDLEYAYFMDGDSAAKSIANMIVRNSTLDFLGMGDVEAKVTPGLETAVKDLDRSFQELKKEFGSSTGWMAEMHTSEVYRNDTILVLEVNSAAYFGGAHGQYFTRYFNFDRRSGKLLPLSSFVDPAIFINRAEEQFKSKYVEDGESYLDAGFDFLEGKYVLSANYAFKGDSILLHYNHYEIAPYAAGQFDVSVPVK